jgi:hypothetical protein
MLFKLQKRQHSLTKKGKSRFDMPPAVAKVPTTPSRSKTGVDKKKAPAASKKPSVATKASVKKGSAASNRQVGAKVSRAAIVTKGKEKKKDLSAEDHGEPATKRRRLEESAGVGEGSNTKKSSAATTGRKPQTYKIHDNGGRPFKVVVGGGSQVSIYKEKLEGCTNVGYLPTPCLTFEAAKVAEVFVGKGIKNDMTKDAYDGFGNFVDGNSVLLHLGGGGNNYVFIGWEIFQFKALAEIVAYNSPVGNSDVPYPFATDTSGRVYLMLDKVVLAETPNPARDPYGVFYEKNMQTKGVTKFLKVRVLQPRQY